MSQKDYIEKIKKAEDSYYVRSLVKTYINKEYNVYNLMNLNISDDKKSALYETIIVYLYDNLFYYHIKEEKDKVLFLKALCYVNPIKESNYYKMLNDISDPVSKFTINELNILTRYIKVYGWQDLEETIGFDKASSIINKIVPFEVIHISYEVIKYANEDNKKKILEAACYNINSFLLAYDKFDDKYKEELINYYIDNNKNEYQISDYIIKNNLIKSDISIIEKSTSTIIYSYLMNNDLSIEDEKRLEKALLKTNDFEYIVYYYFYKNKYMFYKIFTTLVIFLAFVKINGNLFKNKNILEDILNKVKEEMQWFNNHINEVYNYERVKILK